MFQKKIEKKKEIYKGDTVYFRRLFLKSYINLPEFPSRQIVARILLEEKLFFTQLLSRNKHPYYFPRLSNFSPQILLSNTQYTLPTITFIPISNITTSALLFSSLEIIPTPQSYPPLVLLCSLSSPLPPLFLILSPSDSRPIFRISQMGRENGGHVSKNERVGLFET